MPADASAQRQHPNAIYETGAMGRLGDCMADGMIVGTAAGLVVGMFQTEQTSLRVPVMALWGIIGMGAGVWGGTLYWGVHEGRRSHAQRSERPDTVRTPGPRTQAKILRTRPCRGTLPFTSGPTTPTAPREGGLPWVREP